MNRIPRTPLLCSVALAAALCAPGAALASTATIQNANRVNVSSSGNEKNQIAVAYNLALDLYTVTDGAGVTASGTCAQVDPNTVTCPGAGIQSVRVTAAGGNDSVALTPAGWPATIEGDLDGGAGDDTVTGAGANDQTKGGTGKDLLDGGPGADEMRGGSGTDTATYAARTTRVIVTVGANNDNDGNESDQAATSRDTVHGDVETVLGGSAGDILIGDKSDETLFGGDGPDSIQGGRGKDVVAGFLGDDFLSGDAGNDVLIGAAGNDRMLGGSEDDLLAGGPDNDLLRGGEDQDRMRGKGGIDVIQARDGFTDIKISCGPGPNGQEVAKRDRRLDPRAKSC